MCCSKPANAPQNFDCTSTRICLSRISHDIARSLGRKRGWHDSIEIGCAASDAPAFRTARNGVWAYEGTYPGPTIELKPGQRVCVEWRDEIGTVFPALDVVAPPLPRGHQCRTPFKSPSGGRKWLFPRAVRNVARTALKGAMSMAGASVRVLMA